MSKALAFGVALIALAPAAAFAESRDEQMACIRDAFSLCGHAIPDRNRVAACLSQNFGRLTPGCRAVMARYSRPSDADPSAVTDARN